MWLTKWAANAVLIVSSLFIDIFGIFLICAGIFGSTIRPFVALLILFALRQVCQAMCALPAPRGMIWRDPGFPSLLETYGVCNDFFFSGHTAVAMLGAIEIGRKFPGNFSHGLKAVSGTPNAKIELLHFPGSSPGEDLSRFMTNPNTVMDISRLEGNGAVGRMIGSVRGLPSSYAPVDRIVFGSHAPYFPVETALLKLMESPLDAQQLQAIMQGNARRLLPRA